MRYISSEAAIYLVGLERVTSQTRLKFKNSVGGERSHFQMRYYISSELSLMVVFKRVPTVIIPEKP